MTIAALLVIPVLILQDPHRGEPWSTLGDVLDCLSWLTFADTRSRSRSSC